MVKVVSPEQMSQLESQAVQQGASTEEFMEKAGLGIAGIISDWMEEKRESGPICLMLGKGNNAGDTLVAGRHLKQMGFVVQAFALFAKDLCSPLCQKQWTRFLEAKGKVQIVSSKQELAFPEKAIIIDGIFGTGFDGQVKEIALDAMIAANATARPIIAIDVPSGLNGTTGVPCPVAIRAAMTIYLGMAKTGYFLHSGWNHVGQLRGVDFGLPLSLVEKTPAPFLLFEQKDAAPLMPTIQRNRHKYLAGYVIGIAGSDVMPGAAAMASVSVLKSGAGIMRLAYPPSCHASIRPSLPWEVISEPFETITQLTPHFSKANSCFFGPGVGRGDKERTLFQEFIKNVRIPYVIDADGLFLLAGQKDVTLPPHGVLTPHIGEMCRLLESEPPKDPLQMSFLNQVQQYTDKIGATIVLKGSPTIVFHPAKAPVIIPTGDPGMATAGSGDVLTGIIAGLMSQKLNPINAALLGCYIHGLAGMKAACKKTSYSMMAHDIIDSLPCAFREINGGNDRQTFRLH